MTVQAIQFMKEHANIVYIKLPLPFMDESASLYLAGQIAFILTLGLLSFSSSLDSPLVPLSMAAVGFSSALRHWAIYVFSVVVSAILTCQTT